MKNGFLVVLFLSSCASVVQERTVSSEETEPRWHGKPAKVEVVQTEEVADPSDHAQATSPQANEGAAAVPEINKIIQDQNPVFSGNKASLEAEKVPLEIPLEINQKVSEWISYFNEGDRDRTQRFFERGEALRPRIEQILKDNDVPPELYYLAMIESGFVSNAKSRAKAVGLWQFMQGTAKNYGLTVNKHVDERRNWIKATEAAASYLKDLNNVFGSWYLALAAYNAGEHRIVNSIMRGKTRDFWALAEADLLPRETLNYVPKFLAAQIIGKNKEKYGFKNINVDPEDRWEEYDVVTVPAGVSLRELAKVSAVPYEVLHRWNLDLLSGITPSLKNGTSQIYAPKIYAAKFEDKKMEIAKIKRQPLPMAPTKTKYAYGHGDDSYAIYVVQRGDTIAGISKRLRTSTRTLMKINGLRKSRIHAGQRLKYTSRGDTKIVVAKKSRTIASQRRKKTKVEN